MRESEREEIKESSTCCSDDVSFGRSILSMFDSLLSLTPSTGAASTPASPGASSVTLTRTRRRRSRACIVKRASSVKSEGASSYMRCNLQHKRFSVLPKNYVLNKNLRDISPAPFPLRSLPLSYAAAIVQRLAGDFVCRL